MTHPPFPRPRAFDTILYGCLVVGVLDGLAAVMNASFRGISPTRVFQYILSGLLGPASYRGGLVTALVGLLLHFVVALGVATAYYVAASKFPILIRRAIASGVMYGVLVYFFMNRIVVPLSATQKFQFSFANLITGLAIHICFVGLPIALIARRSAKANH